MNQPIVKRRLRTIPQDVYPVLRVTTEFYLRGFDLLNRLHGDVVEGLLFVTVVHGQLAASDSQPPSIRDLSRALGVPYETARRHVVELLRRGQLVEKAGGVVVPAKVRNGRHVSAFLRGIHDHAIRTLIDLTAIKVARYRKKAASRSPARKLAEQRAIALAGTATLLAGLKALRDFWEGDVVGGLVYTAIWMANVKHIANTGSVDVRDVLGDELRVPVSVFAVANSLGLPYETVRRHVQSLIDEDIVVRVGLAGLIVPEKSHRRRKAGALLAYQVTMDFLAGLRAAGVKV